MRGLGLTAGLPGHDAADVDQVVGNHPEADPALPASPLYWLRSNPFRRLTTLMRPSQSVRHFWPLRTRASSARVCGPGSWWSDWGCRRSWIWRPPRFWPSRSRHLPPPGAVRSPALLDSGDEQIRVAGRLIVDFVGDDDLVLRLLQFDHLAEFGGLAGLTFTNDLGCGLEQADDLALGMCAVRAARDRTCSPHRRPNSA